MIKVRDVKSALCATPQATRMHGYRDLMLLAFSPASRYNPSMRASNVGRTEVLQMLRRHEAALRARGIDGLVLFGSIARDDATGDSDIDLAVSPGKAFSKGGFDHFGQMEALRMHLSALLGRRIDLVELGGEVRPGLQQAIARDGIRAF